MCRLVPIALVFVAACAPDEAPEPLGPVQPAAHGSLADDAVEPVEPSIAEPDEPLVTEADEPLVTEADVDIDPDPMVLAQMAIDLGPATASNEPIRWVHPLAGQRHLPGRASRKFGAARDGHRPLECGAGHCGVDIGGIRGDTVHAAADGTIARMSRVPIGRAGIFVVVAHGQGIESSYVHLDEIRFDLDIGSRVDAGEPIGILGRTGIRHSDPHLHFAVAQWNEGERTYLDPEPVLETATLLAEARSLGPGMAGFGAPVLGTPMPDLLAPVAPIPETPSYEHILITVIDGHTGHPVPGARIDGSAPGRDRVSAMTDATGRAALRVEDGDYTVRARAYGYAVSGRLSASAGGDARFELRRGAILAGVVRDADGERVAGATVSVGTARTTSDSAGQFRLADAPTGAILLTAEIDDSYGDLSIELAPGDEYVTLQIDLD